MYRYYSECSSILSGLVVSGISTPFDVVKNYWIYNPQLDSIRTSTSLRQVLRHLYNKGGIRAFYTGFGAACSTILPANYIFFKCYENLLEYDNPAIAGMKARTVAVILTAPCECIRTTLQANAGSLQARDLLRSHRSTRGLSALSRGIMVTLLRDSPFSAIYWTLNERIKKILFDWCTHNSEIYVFCIVDSGHSSTIPTSHLKVCFIYPFISGAVSSAVASTVTQPLDVIKTNIQGAPVSKPFENGASLKWNLTYQIAAKIYSSQGWKGFFVGLAPRLAKIIPSCAFLLASHDFFKAAYLQNNAIRVRSTGS